MRKRPNSLLRMLVAALGAAALAYPAATAAAGPGCDADRKLSNAFIKLIADDQQQATVQVGAMLEIQTLISQGQQAPAALVQRVKTATTRRSGVLDRGEKTITLLKAGSANGRSMKQLALRFIRNVARPFNACIAKMLVAQTASELKATVDCMTSVQRRTQALSRSIDALFAKIKAEKRRCP
jgi:hypothetical protein